MWLDHRFIIWITPSVYNNLHADVIIFKISKKWTIGEHHSCERKVADIRGAATTIEQCNWCWPQFKRQITIQKSPYKKSCKIKYAAIVDDIQHVPASLHLDTTTCWSFFYSSTGPPKSTVCKAKISTPPPCLVDWYGIQSDVKFGNLDRPGRPCVSNTGQSQATETQLNRLMALNGERKQSGT